MIRQTITKILREDFNKILEYNLKDIQKIYNIEYLENIDNIKFILYEIIINKNKNIISFVNRSKNLFDIVRYKQYNENKVGPSSKEYFKLVYGEKWQEFWDKKIHRNMYDPNYIMIRDNCTYDDAVTLINNLKKKKSMTFDAFINRHGVENGTLLYEKFKKTSNIFCLDNLKRIYGNEAENKLAEYKQKNIETSCWRPEYYMNKLNCTYEEAVKEVSNFQKYKSGVSYDAILKRNNGNAELSKELYENINKKKDAKSYNFCLKLCNNDECSAIILYKLKCKQCDNISLKYLLNKGVDLKTALEYQKNRKYREYVTKIKLGIVSPIELLDDYEKYYKKVKYYTNKNLSAYKHLISKKTNINNSLDHKISRFYGFMNDIEEWKIGHISNLEYITKNQNSKKNIKNSMSLEQLDELIFFFTEYTIK